MRFNLVKLIGDIFDESDFIKQDLDTVKILILPKLRKHEKYKELKKLLNSVQKHNSKLNKNVLKIITHKFVSEED